MHAMSDWKSGINSKWKNNFKRIGLIADERNDDNQNLIECGNVEE